MSGTGLVWLLGIIALVLLIAALVKYLMSKCVSALPGA